MNACYAYYYAPADLGLGEFPPGYMRLRGFDVTTDPASADCFVLPCDIRHVTDRQIRALRYLSPETERRHVFYSNAEYPRRAFPLADAIVFRTDHNLGLARSGNSKVMTWAWAVDDLAAYVPLPEGGFEFDCHFQGWRSTPLVDTVCESVVRAGLAAHVQVHDFFYGTLESAQDPRLAELRRTFLESMQRSRLVLVPRSKPEGVVRWRFYEALSMGRVPVHFCDECVLPFEDRVDWSTCTIRIREGDAARTGSMLKEWLRTHEDEEIIAMGAHGRAIWETWLAPAVWEDVWGQVVRERVRSRERVQ